MKQNYLVIAILTFMLCRNTIESALDYHERLQYIRKSKDDLNIIIEELKNKESSNILHNFNDEFQLNELEEAMEELHTWNDNSSTITVTSRTWKHTIIQASIQQCY